MFRFTIRELVLLTLVVAMGVGWWIDRRLITRQQQKQKEYVRDLEQLVQNQFGAFQSLAREREREDRGFTGGSSRSVSIEPLQVEPEITDAEMDAIFGTDRILVPKRVPPP